MKKTFTIFSLLIILFFILPTALILLPENGNDYQFILKWGSCGQGDGEFAEPQDVAVDASGNVYIADNGNSRVQKFNADGVFVTSWEWDFYATLHIAIDPDENVNALDDSGIHIFSPEGTHIADYEEAPFDRPRGIAIDASGNFYIANHRAGNILKLSSNGTFITSWGEGQVDGPYGIAVDAYENVYVANNGNSLIHKFTSDGVLLTTWGSEGQFSYPHGIAVDASGNVYVADTGNNRIQKFTSDGVFITTWGSEGEGDGQFNWAQGIAVSYFGNVYVSDNINCNIHKFGNTPTGTNVEIFDSTSGTSITFSEIIAGGGTTVYITEQGPPPSTGFRLVPSGTYYEIVTSAIYTGIISVCINYDDSGLNQQQENNLTLRQYEPDIGDWFDLTVSLDTTNNIICGETSHLSFFGVMVQDVIPATVEINPDTVNLKSKGNWISCYIELPPEYDPNDIDITTVTMSRETSSVPAETSPYEVGDFDSDGILDLMVKFDRYSFHQMLVVGTIQLTVKGSIVDGTSFEGVGAVNVIDKGK